MQHFKNFYVCIQESRFQETEVEKKIIKTLIHSTEQALKTASQSTQSEESIFQATFAIETYFH